MRELVLVTRNVAKVNPIEGMRELKARAPEYQRHQDRIDTAGGLPADRPTHLIVVRTHLDAREPALNSDQSASGLLSPLNALLRRLPSNRMPEMCV